MKLTGNVHVELNSKKPWGGKIGVFNGFLISCYVRNLLCLEFI